MVGLVVLAIAYAAVFLVFLVLIIGLGRAAASSRRVDEEAADPGERAAAEQLTDELEALVNATHCDCPRCTARRRRVTP